MPFGHEFDLVVSTQVPSASNPLLMGTVQAARLKRSEISPAGDNASGEGIARTVNGNATRTGRRPVKSFMIMNGLASRSTDGELLIWSLEGAFDNFGR